MSKIVYVLPILALLSGCVWPSDLTPEVNAVVALVASACSFQVTTDSVLNIIAAANPSVVGAEAVAAAICAAVKAAPKGTLTTEKAPVLSPNSKAGKSAVENCARVNGVCVVGQLKE